MPRALASVIVAFSFVSFVSAVWSPANAEEDSGIALEKADTLPNDEALKLLGQTLGRSVEATQFDPGIPDILKALETNIAATRRIRELIDGAEAPSDAKLGEVVVEISRIAKSFRAIADLAPGVFERRWQQLANIDAIGQAIGFRVADANARLAELKRGNAEIDRYVKAETLSPAEIEKLRLTRTANDAEIHSIETAIVAWRYFSERHTEVVAKLGDQSEDLDVFFHALRENARVYEAAAQTLNMANSLKTALNDLGTVENLDSLRSELVRSWTDLMKIVDEVNDGLLLQPGM